MSQGKVYLVGAGPGDETLITLKGKNVLEKADVILYDRLINPMLLQYATDRCEFIYCGKLPDRHILRQEKINQLLVHYANLGKIVVRLKGGDPSVFGRVGEEAYELASHNISFEIVPGITSGIAAPSYSGIPVTHREYGESFAIITAHNKSSTGKPKIDWKSLSNGIDTLAFYMGIANLPYICESLLKHGKPADTPVILIQWGTMGKQKTLQGTLATIAKKAEKADIRNPAITLVGNIIELREKINWFEKKPLFGRQILLAQSSIYRNKLAAQLRELGADVVEIPKLKKISEMTKIKQTILSKIEKYETFIFTSLEATEQFFLDLLSEKIDIRSIKARFYSINEEVLVELTKRGFTATGLDRINSHENMLIIGENKDAINGELYATHRVAIDSRFDQIYRRLVEETNYDTIIFPTHLSVNLFNDYVNTLLNCGDSFYNEKQVISIGDETFIEAKRNNISSKRIPNNININVLQEYFIHHTETK
ncbi:uroporphyrinogen-III C-methyltransferase [Bacillus sp. 7586-K]|nr:uroporphyrinogen-III C-methyltransferase [Bacillus sp. 7586-K]